MQPLQPTPLSLKWSSTQGYQYVMALSVSASQRLLALFLPHCLGPKQAVCRHRWLQGLFHVALQGTRRWVAGAFSKCSETRMVTSHSSGVIPKKDHDVTCIVGSSGLCAKNGPAALHYTICFPYPVTYQHQSRTGHYYLHLHSTPLRICLP